MRTSKSIACCFMVCVAAGLFLSTSNQAEADVTYTLSGFANNLGFPDPTSPVGAFETYTAVFEIDDTVVDSDPSSTRGEYDSAILSSSVVFSGGYTSTVDFSGGEVVVRQDASGFGIILSAPGAANTPGSGAIVLYSLSPFGPDIDALISSPQQVAGLPGSLWSLTETNGSNISSFSTASQSLAVTASAVPEPSSMALLGFGLVIASVRRRKS